jgi:glutathione S-transferase
MKFYDSTRAPNPRRVRIFLAEKGIEVPTVQVDLMNREHKSDAFKRLNPLGAIPVLELDDGDAIAESVAICRYFEELHPEPALFGRGAKGRAQVEMWNRRIEFGLMGPIGQVWIHGSPLTARLFEQVPAAAEFNRTVAARFLGFLDGALADRPFFAGDDYSVADISALCTLDFAAALVGIPIDPSHANLTRWHGSVSARPSAKA